MPKINLEEFADGSLSEKLNIAFKKVTDNVLDPNTKATAKRKIVCTFTFAPNENRDLSAMSIDVKESIAPSLGIATALIMGKDLTTNEVDFREFNKQVPGQMSIQEMKKVSEQIHTFQGSNGPRTGYDPSTGEIYSLDEEETVENRDKVVDLRSAR